jgi:hypothetical protein
MLPMRGTGGGPVVDWAVIRFGLCDRSPRERYADAETIWRFCEVMRFFMRDDAPSCHRRCEKFQCEFLFTSTDERDRVS